MKKIISASLILLLAGCSTSNEDSESIRSIESDAVAPSSLAESIISKESTSSEQVSSSAESEKDSLPIDSSIRLYVPDTLREDEGSDLFGEVIDVAEQFTTESAPLSEEGLFTLSYTGYYIENEEGNIQAYFIGVNRVGEPLSNLSFTLNFLVGETAVWDNIKFTLDESEFGVQPNQSAMPIFLDIPVDKEQILMDAKPEETFIEIKDLVME